MKDWPCSSRTLPRVVFFLLLFLPSCGYHFDEGLCFRGGTSFSVPYIDGDERGYMTAALIREACARLPLNYSSQCGDCVIKVSLVGQEKNNIGYRLAPKKQVDDKEVVVAEEGRLTLIAMVSVLQSTNGKILFGPLEVRKSLTFDFEPDFSNVDDHNFSLGQLEMESMAEDAALTSLQKLLAQKIVDSLLYCW